MKKGLVMVVCLLLLSLFGCSAGSDGTSGNPDKVPDHEGDVSSGVSDHTEEPDQNSGGDASIRLLVKESLHRTEMDGQVTSYVVPVYAENGLSIGAERYTPDDILLETVDECTYEFNEAERTLVCLPASQLYQKTYVFDEAGRLVESKSENANGTIAYWYVWIYDDSGLPLKKVSLDSKGSETSDVWNYIYDESGNIVRREDAYGAWTEFTYDEEGYPLTVVTYDRDGEKSELWSSFEYAEASVESLPEFMGPVKQWILVDLVY